MRTIRATEIPWLVDSAERLGDWLISHHKRSAWTVENRRLPGMYRWTVEQIAYESLFTDLWAEPWFQRGIQACGLLALEMEGVIKIVQSDSGEFHVACSDGEVYEMNSFLSGESIPYRHDPEYSDLCWDPVDAVGHILAEYRREEELDSDVLFQ